jgi:uncharacterized protein YndB with AHSA1/START domain
MTKLFVEKSTEINAPASKVWAILTKPEFTREWAGMFGATGPIDSDWQLGSQVLWKNAAGKVYVYGKVVALEPNKLLQFTVRSVKPELQPISGSDKDDITQTYVLLEQDGNTSLSIEHGDFSMLANGEKIGPGAMTVWDKVLPKIKELAEK